MKIFISWSGEPSKKIAEIMRKWIKNVIQSVEPFVSSEDIEKGSRWSADIAKELEDTNFGLLCVTKDNFKAPWLLFEAGALSKAMDKALVVPMLFGLKPSDLTGSPLLQFQTVIFSKNEVKKLIVTLNDKIEKRIDSLDEIFEKWYPDLEDAVAELEPGTISQGAGDDLAINTNQSPVLEEILTISRDNQKLLRNSENIAIEKIGNIEEKISHLSDNRNSLREHNRRKKKLHPMMLDELLYFRSEKFGSNDCFPNYGFLIALSLFREDYPWVYDLGKELLDVLNSKKSNSQKQKSIEHFINMLEETPRLLHRLGYREDDEMLFFELPRIFHKILDRFE
ncbi:MAG: toll/interleukin-1 receptor domain-containing protein [Defluviitaleaceae bacterium]|nr:toll/interleukin-1 receptor domain-containing protein [Defluviitaleaceae bacterium]